MHAIVIHELNPKIMVEKELDVATEMGPLYFIVRILKIVYLTVYIMSMLTCFFFQIIYTNKCTYFKL
jgi:hypothetical protein